MRPDLIPDNDHIFNVREAAAYLKVAPVTIYRLATKGELPCQKVGGQWRFLQRALDAFLVGDLLSPQAAEAILHALPLAVER
jgi:excisionase family DNA binding protein